MLGKSLCFVNLQPLPQGVLIENGRIGIAKPLPNWEWNWAWILPHKIITFSSLSSALDLTLFLSSRVRFSYPGRSFPIWNLHKLSLIPSFYNAIIGMGLYRLDFIKACLFGRSPFRVRILMLGRGYIKHPMFFWKNNKKIKSTQNDTT